VFADPKRWESAITQTLVLRESLGRKFDAVDVAEHPWMRLVAYRYSATYRGDFEYMLSQRDALTRYPTQTDRQVAGVLNCAVPDWRRSARPVAGSNHLLPNVTDVPSSRYRVVQPDGKSLSVRLDSAAWAKDRPEGTRALYYLGQGAEWQFAGFIDPTGDIRVIARERHMVKSLHAALTVLTESVPEGRWLVHALAFSLEGSVCCFCGRELDTAESISVGYGPVCADKHGLPWGEVAEPASVVLARDAIAHGGIDAEPEPEETPARVPQAGDGLRAHDVGVFESGAAIIAKTGGVSSRFADVVREVTGREPAPRWRPGRTYEEIFGDD